MPTSYADEVIMSGLSDVSDLPLDAEVNLDDAECACIMRRIGIIEDGPGTSVSAFNSFI